MRRMTVFSFAHAAFAITVLLSLTMTGPQASHALERTHGLAMHGKPLLPRDFEHFPYADPNAKKGGRIVYGSRGSFDSVNPFILKGQKVRGLRDGFLGNNVYESLMTRTRDEPFTLYGLLAKEIIIPEDRSFIELYINPKARFSDGHPVTADDVIFSTELLAEKGRPNYRNYYSRVERLEKIDELTVRITFKNENGYDRELPLLIGLMPILPAHDIDPETFDQTTLDPFIGSGPYTVAEVDQGSHLLLKRNPDYWAKDHPTKRGLHNFDEIRIDYYRDENAFFEAFKKGLVDVYFESDPVNWATAYDGRAFRDGELKKSVFTTRVPRGVRGYAFNTRRVPLDDARVREALMMMFDFEWINANLFNGGFSRTVSFWQGSELSSLDQPISEQERRLLGDYVNDIRPGVLDGTYRPVKTDGSGRDRQVLRQALTLLREAGFQLEDGVMLTPNGEPFEIELLLPGGTNESRLASAYGVTLRLLGINLIQRGVDAAQFEERRKSYDFDMILWNWSGSLSPGNEQYFRWSSPFADKPGTFNLSGVKSPAIDAMINELVAAKPREDFIAAVRSLDRLLINGKYVLPLYHLNDQLIAHNVRIKFPEETPIFGAHPPTWWIDE